MRELSVRSLLISHFAMFVVFCCFLMVGYGAILAVLHVISGSDLSDLHQRLKLDELFKDIESASALSLSAVVAGWLAARYSNTRPLLHGALSCAAFFLLFLCNTVYGLFHFSGIDWFRHRLIMNLSELALPIFGIIGAWLLLLGRGMRRLETRPDKSLAPMPDDFLGDLGPIAWKWLVRLIWFGSVAVFEILEILRYRNGQTYRPFFAFFAAAIFASVIWLMACVFRDKRQWRQVRAQRAASGQLRSPLYIAANGLVLVLFGLTFCIARLQHGHAEIPSFLWIVVALVFVALLLLRRALKWHYPYV